MRKTIAHIALSLMLVIPAISLIAVISADRQEASVLYQLTFPDDFEDQQDDSDPTKDNETGADGEFLMEKYSLLQLPILLRQSESRQERLFRDHHREVVTPPPKG